MKKKPTEELEKTIVVDSQKNKKNSEVPLLFPTEGSFNALTDRYKTIKTFGEDSLETITLAEDTFLRREVILKTFQKKQSLSKAEKFRFIQFVTEAKVTGILEHPNILPLYDKQELPRKLFYFTLRKITGQTLHQILLDIEAEAEDVDFNWLLTVFLKVCDAISYAHSQGYLHQNLSSENILVGEYGEVYITDWGFAGKIGKVNPEQILWFQENTKLLVHIAPEQKENGNKAKVQSDIHALGQLLERCFFTNIPADIEAIVIKATQIQWSKRYLSVQEIITDIENHSKNLRVSVREYTPLELTAKWIARNKKALLALLFGLIVFSSIFWKSYSEKNKRLKKDYQNYFDKAKASQEELRQETLRQETNLDKRIELFFSTRDQLEEAIESSRLLEYSENRLNDLYEIGKSLVVQSSNATAYSFAEDTANIFEKEKRKQDFLDLIKREKEEKKGTSEKNQKKIREQYLKFEKELEKKSFALQEKGVSEEKKIVQQLSELIKTEENIRQDVDKKLKQLNRKNFRKEGEAFYNILVKAFAEIDNQRIKSILENLQESILYLSPEERFPSEIRFLTLLVDILYPKKALNYGLRNNLYFYLEEEEIFKSGTKHIYGNNTKLDSYLEKYIERAKYKEAQGNLTGAKQDYQRALNLENIPSEKKLEIYLQLGEIEETKKQFEKAEESYKQAESLTNHRENKLKSYLKRGRVQIMLKKYDDAIKLFKLVLPTPKDPNNSYLYLALIGQSLAYFKLDKPKEAKEKWNEAEQEKNKDFDESWNKFIALAYYQRGKDFYDLKKYEKALEYCEKAKQMDVFLIEAYRISGKCKRRMQQNLQEALEEFNIVIRHSHITEDYYERGIIKEHLKMMEEAKKDYKIFLKETESNNDLKIQENRKIILLNHPKLMSE